MGFIKAIAGATSQLGESYREVIQWDKNDNNMLVNVVTTESGMIQDQSRLFVQPGQCAIYTDQGAIKDIITEPGMYFMDTTAPTLFQVDVLKGVGGTFLETVKRIAYEGAAISKQKVYFINLTEKVGLPYGTPTPIIYKDPEWGPIEIKLYGNYTLKVVNPVNLLVNVCGNREYLTVEDLAMQIRAFILSELAVNVGKLGVSFDMISANQTILAEGVINNLASRFESFGIEITKIVISSVEVAEEVKQAMRERTGIKMKATSVDSNQADIYTKLNTAEAIKDMANNQSNNGGATIMGMNVGNTIAGVVNGTINDSMNNQNQ